MKPFLLKICVLAAAVFWFVLPSRCRAAGREAAPQPLIVAHYMPWFEAKPVSRQWGWHWTMNAFDPEQKTGGKRRIASRFYPLIGPYDSGDPAVLEYHLLSMKLAGINGVIVDWYGLSDLYDYPLVHRNTVALFEAATRLGMKVGICYEDQTIPKLVETKRIAAEYRVKTTMHDLQWLHEHWFNQPSYLKVNARPVLLSFGYAGLNDEEWKAALPAAGTSVLYLSEHRRRSAANGAFDWPQPQAGLAALDTFYATVKGASAGKEMAAFMPVAFPRFADIYKAAGVQAGYPEIGDDQGRTFATSLERGLQSGAPLVQLATWNDWGEGTNIEPSQEFGYRDLEVVQKQRRNRDAHFTATPDDLRLPFLLWQLRGRQSELPVLKPKLDAAARLLAAGKIAEARASLQQMETLVSH